MKVTLIYKPEEKELTLCKWAMPEIAPYLVPSCIWHGGVCHEIESCGRCIHE